MRKNKYLVPMDDDIHDLILYSLINWKNALIREGRYTDAMGVRTESWTPMGSERS